MDNKRIMHIPLLKMRNFLKGQKLATHLWVLDISLVRYLFKHEYGLEHTWTTEKINKKHQTIQMYMSMCYQQVNIVVTCWFVTNGGEVLLSKKIKKITRTEIVNSRGEREIDERIIERRRLKIVLEIATEI